MMIRKVGYRFRPDLEALAKALKYKAKGGDISLYPSICPGDIVEIEDLYGEGKEPWKLFSGSNEITELHDVDDWQQRSRVKYIVTKLSRIGPKNYSRGAGAGSWDVQGTRPVVVKGQEILKVGTLTYEFRGDPTEAASKPHYWMHEYHLSQDSLERSGLSQTDYVLCRVIKDLSKRCHIKKGGKKRATSSTITVPKKKAKKSSLPNQDVEGCSSPLLNKEPFVTLDDFPDILFESCANEAPDCPGIWDHGGVIDTDDCNEEPPYVTLDDFPDMLFESCENEALDCAGVCNPGGVIDHDHCENVVGCSLNLLNDHEQVLTLDDFPAMTFGNQENLVNDHEAEEEEEEEMTMDEYSNFLFGNDEDQDF